MEYGLKTNQFGNNPVKISIVKNTSSVLCPVYWLTQLVKCIPKGRDKYVFNVRIKGEFVPMSYSWLRGKLSELRAVLPW